MINSSITGENTSTVPEAQAEKHAEATRYFGGKGGSGVYQTIINQIPMHDVYREVFLGMGSIIRYKRPAKISYGVERHVPAATKFNQLFAPDIPNFRLINGDALQVLSVWDCMPVAAGKTEFMYVDPPYPLGTRTSNHRYNNELTDEEHIKLCALLRQCTDCGYLIAISTYPNDIYKQELAGWRAVPYTSTDSGGNIRDELLYCNYPEPEILHDPSYVGPNNDKRSDINKRIKRNINKLAQWEPNERLRLLSHVLATMPDAEKAALQNLTESGYVNHD